MLTNNIKAYTIKMSILFTILLTCYSNAFAQQTIINAPSSEVLPAGDILLKDSNGFRPFSEGYTSITPSATMGIGRGMELSTGISTKINDSTLVRSDIAAKKVWFIGSTHRITLGGIISPYLSEKNQPNSFIYTHFSHRIKKTKTSLTAGIYLDGQNSLPENFGAIVGIEQVIIPNKLRIALDWLSTSDSYGKIGAGFKYRPVPTVSITSAIIVPNDDSDNIAFNLSISKFISLDDENPIKRRLKNVD